MKFHNKKLVNLFAAALFLFQAFTANVYSQNITSGEDKTITALKVKNNKAISTETVLSKIRTKAGDKLSQEVLNDDLKRLYATQYFTDVSLDIEDYEGGFAVTFIVEEKPTIDDIVFKGNSALRAQKLKSTMKSKANEMLNLALLAQDISEIKSLYVKKGYPMADVKYAVDLEKETNKAILTITIDEKTRVKVASVKITGNKAIKTPEIRKVLGTKPAWLFFTGVYSDDVFQEDVERIKAIYDDIGFMDAEVKPKMDYSKEGTILDITLEIQEGKQYLVGDVALKGNLVFPEKDLRSNMKMKTGKPFSGRELRDDSFNLRQYYYKYGYMNVVIDLERDLNQATGNIDIVYNIDAKEVVYVGKIEIRGNIKTRDVVIRREIRIYPGQKFSGERIKRSKERIYNLGFFENVVFDTEPTEIPNVQNLIVSVKETKTGEFSFGGGYSSVDMLVGFVEITQRNFDIINFPTFTGGGQNLTIKAELGIVRNNFNLGWTDPWIFGRPFLFGFDVYRTSHNRSGDLGWAYDEVRAGGDLRLGKELTDTFRSDLFYRLEQIEISNLIDNASKDFRDEVGTNVVSSLTLQLTQDTRDNVFNPGKGYIVNGSIEDAGGIFFGDKEFVKGTAAASYYHTFFDKFVLEVKGRMGLSNAYGNSDEVPVYERFYAGGANTIRGYRERRVGPRDPGSNEPIGGEALLIGNAELTFPLYEKVVKAAVFYDAGNVWRRAEDFIAGGNYKSGMGVCLRVKTPVGPVRVDYGYPLVRNFDDERTGEFYFSMSRGF
ncbi:MAG: outer membrane protein assembly factor BamA [Candidatus Omnitrophota bacterium]|nr:outer membrane protein assembly factor BamA [Candidatus Omnitrophota bacterium]